MVSLRRGRANLRSVVCRGSVHQIGLAPVVNQNSIRLAGRRTEHCVIQSDDAMPTTFLAVLTASLATNALSQIGAVGTGLQYRDVQSIVTQVVRPVMTHYGI